MATLTALVTGVGEGAQGPPIFGGGSNVMQLRTYQFSFDSSYPTGGESISGIWSDFGTVHHIWVGPRGAQLFEVDYSGKKLKLFTAVGTEASNASDQSAVTTVRLTVLGYPK